MAAHPEHVLDKGLARQSYMNAMDRTARLTAFSLAERLVDADDDVSERCRQLAVDDLTLLAISLRRLAEATSLEAKTRNVWVSTLRFESDDLNERAIRDGQISLWDVLGIVVHARAIQVLDDNLSLAMWLAPRAIDAAARTAGDRPRWIDPICFARSDRKSVTFLISEFTMRVAQLLDSAREACCTHGLYLSSWFDDI